MPEDPKIREIREGWVDLSLWWVSEASALMKETNQKLSGSPTGTDLMDAAASTVQFAASAWGRFVNEYLDTVAVGSLMDDTIVSVNSYTLTAGTTPRTLALDGPMTGFGSASGKSIAVADVRLEPKKLAPGEAAFTIGLRAQVRPTPGLYGARVMATDATGNVETTPVYLLV